MGQSRITFLCSNMLAIFITDINNFSLNPLLSNPLFYFSSFLAEVASLNLSMHSYLQCFHFECKFVCYFCRMLRVLRIFSRVLVVCRAVYLYACLDVKIHSLLWNIRSKNNRPTPAASLADMSLNFSSIFHT